MDFAGRLAIQQRVLPDYRRGLFDGLARSCRGGVSVFAGYPRRGEGIVPASDLGSAHWERARNIHLLGGPFYLCLQPGITSWLDRFQPDVLVIETNPRELTNRLASAWMRRRGRPVLGWGLGAVPGGGLAAPLRRALRRANLRGLSGLIAYSTTGKREFEALGFPSSRVFVAPNAVAPRPSGPLDSPTLRLPSGHARRLLDSSAHGPFDRAKAKHAQHGPPRLLFVGRLQPRKRVDLLLEACASLAGPIELSIVGDGPARHDLESLARRVFPAAEFRGDQRGAALEALFDEADLFVLPGTGGLAVQQALAHGLPVIVARGDGTQQDMVTPENGWLVPEGDGAALKSAIATALSDRTRLEAMGRASRRLADRAFNLEAMVEAFLVAVNAVAGKGS